MRVLVSVNRECYILPKLDNRSLKVENLEVRSSRTRIVYNLLAARVVTSSCAESSRVQLFHYSNTKTAEYQFPRWRRPYKPQQHMTSEMHAVGFLGNLHLNTINRLRLIYIPSHVDSNQVFCMTTRLLRPVC